MSFEGAAKPQKLPDEDLEQLIQRVVEKTIAHVNATTQSPFIRSNECARIMDVTPQHLCCMRAKGEGPPWSGEGKWVRYERTAVLDWIAALPIKIDAPTVRNGKVDAGLESTS